MENKIVKCGKLNISNSNSFTDIPDKRLQICPYEKKITKNKLMNKPDFIEFFVINVEMAQNERAKPTKSKSGKISSCKGRR